MSNGKSESPSWSTATKAVVAIALLVVLAWILLRIHNIIPLLTLAAILTFLVVPVVQFLHHRARLPWGLSANLVMLVLILSILGVSTASGLAALQQLQALILIIQRFLTRLPAMLEEISQQTLIFGPWVFDLSQFDLAALAEQLLTIVQPLLRNLSSLIASLATGALESAARVVFVLAITYFLTFDYRQIRLAVHRISIPGFEDDFHRLRIALSRIWQAFLRGQLLVVFFTGLLTWGLMSFLGVRFSLGLGLLGGLAKFVPIVGPITAGLIAAIVALFQPANWFGLAPFGHAVLVVVCVIILDQGIDYLLIPRIMGTTLNLHPVLVLIALLIGATIAGVIGLLLSSPTMASVILLGRYTYRKMFDLSPWDPPIDDLGKQSPQAPLLLRWWRRLSRRWRSS